ncbi:SagB/ThcOx family dehydrogenase [Methanosphaerula palustris]|uniref:Nitroreductase n=1 Tax=Methanosphaerula palustris (strain ATCC BAA-1556 / DSM 19958 / E1-9c) TaxID=521011 RepID=B8GJ14_METPE|nr:SagB/ThcOx family dehydrogenase [Methanosphaerula palustris]ACL15587.1 nitroreductase [Methanosphaerula palustris E1-9c]
MTRESREDEQADDCGQVFREITAYPSSFRPDQIKGIPRPPLELPPSPESTPIPLPRPEAITVRPVDLRVAIEKRRSVRWFDNEEPLSLEELAYLLWCTQGVQEVVLEQYTLRTAPSAGAAHPLETYLLVNCVEGLEPGIYRYLALEHTLELINSHPEIALAVTEGCMEQQMVLRSAVTFLWTAVPYRTTWRYGPRGYRDIYIDAGHVCQNLYLAAGPIDCGVCAIESFQDDYMNRLLGLDGKTQFLIYCAAVGKIRHGL